MNQTQRNKKAFTNSRNTGRSQDEIVPDSEEERQERRYERSLVLCYGPYWLLRSVRPGVLAQIIELFSSDDERTQPCATQHLSPICFILMTICRASDNETGRLRMPGSWETPVHAARLSSDRISSYVYTASLNKSIFDTQTGQNLFENLA